MTPHLPRQIEKLKKMIMNLGAIVEDAVRHATYAIERRDPDLAADVVAGDREIDLLEIDIEEECLATLALHQPVANDLRFVVSILKINRDLERIGDMAAHVSELAATISKTQPINMDEYRISEMMRKTQTMLKQSLDALVQLDVGLAKVVQQTDAEVDEIQHEVCEKIEKRILEKPDQIQSLIRLWNMARKVERMADHTVNIAKDVIYLVSGHIVRHSRGPTP